MDAIDKQLLEINKAEASYKSDSAALTIFWEDLWANGGPKFNGVHWTFRLVDLYVRAERYDDAWKMLNEFIITKPNYIVNTRKWQIKVLKEEKKDYSHIQQLLDNGK